MLVIQMHMRLDTLRVSKDTLGTNHNRIDIHIPYLEGLEKWKLIVREKFCLHVSVNTVNKTSTKHQPNSQLTAQPCSDVLRPGQLLFVLPATNNTIHIPSEDCHSSRTVFPGSSQATFVLHSFTMPSIVI